MDLSLQPTKLKLVCLKKGTKINYVTDRPWWPSGLSNHVSNSSRDRHLGPRLESRLGLQF